MHAHAKAHVPILGAVEVDLVGVGEHSLVAIRHRQVTGDPTALRQRVPGPQPAVQAGGEQRLRCYASERSVTKAVGSVPPEFRQDRGGVGWHQELQSQLR